MHEAQQEERRLVSGAGDMETEYKVSVLRIHKLWTTWMFYWDNTKDALKRVTNCILWIYFQIPFKIRCNSNYLTLKSLHTREWLFSITPRGLKRKWISFFAGVIFRSALRGAVHHPSCPRGQALSENVCQGFRRDYTLQFKYGEFLADAISRALDARWWANVVSIGDDDGVAFMLKMGVLVDNTCAKRPLDYTPGLDPTRADCSVFSIWPVYMTIKRRIFSNALRCTANCFAMQYIQNVISKECTATHREKDSGFRLLLIKWCPSLKLVPRHIQNTVVWFSRIYIP